MRRRQIGALVIALIVILALAIIDRAGGVLPVDDDWRRYHGRRFEVVRVIDGDTLVLDAADGEYPTTRVRLWGVDTPELANRAQGKPAEPWAEEAAAYTRRRAEGAWVTLRLQRHRLRGRYGRLLAYVVMPDGRELNAELIEQGLSESDDRWGHDRVEHYDTLERLAKRAERGLWSD